MDESVNWIPCREAVDMVDQDNPHDAMQAVAKRAAYGLVRARADMMIISTRIYRGNWSKPVREADAAVPQWYWEKCGNRDHPWGPHVLGSDMQGQGDNCGRSGVEAKVELFGVRFAEPDLLSMTPNGKMRPPSAAIATHAKAPGAVALKPVPVPLLKEWFKGFQRDQDIAAMSVDDEIYPAAKAYFARNIVSRQRIRDLVGEVDPVRKQGPKPFRQDDTA